LVVHLSFDPERGVIWLQLADKLLIPSPPSPIVATLPVIAGQKYSMTAFDPARWDYAACSCPSY
jgi:hypothetical protein